MQQDVQKTLNGKDSPMIGFFGDIDDENGALKKALEEAIASGNKAGLVIFNPSGGSNHDFKPKVIQAPSTNTKQ